MKRRVFALGAAGTAIGLAGCSTMPGSNLPSGSSTRGGGSSDSADEGASSGGASDSSRSDSGESGTTESDTGSGEPDGAGSEGGGEETQDVELEENEPTAVVETFYDALYASDVDTANDLLHPDSPEPLYSQEAVERFEGVSHQLEGVEVTEDSGGTAVVEFVLVLTDSGGEESRTEMGVELRLDGEDWKIWEAE